MSKINDIINSHIDKKAIEKYVRKFPDLEESKYYTPDINNHYICCICHELMTTGKQVSGRGKHSFHAHVSCAALVGQIRLKTEERLRIIDNLREEHQEVYK